MVVAASDGHRAPYELIAKFIQIAITLTQHDLQDFTIHTNAYMHKYYNCRHRLIIMQTSHKR